MSEIESAGRTVLPHKGIERVDFFFALVMIGLVILAMLGLFPGRRGRYDDGLDFITGGILMGIALLSILSAFRKFNIPEKGIQISPTGVFDPQLMKSEVPWENIQGAQVMISGGHRVFAVQLREKTKQTLSSRLLNAVDRNPGFGYRAWMFGRPLEQVESEFNAARMKYQPQSSQTGEFVITPR